MGLYDILTSKLVRPSNDATIDQQQLTNLYNENVFRWLNDNNPIFKEQEFDYIENGYMSVGAVYECVDIIQKKITACPRIVYEVKDKKELKKYQAKMKGGTIEAMGEALLLKQKALTEVHVPRIEKLLNDPNKLQTGDEFFTFDAGMYMLTGNSYIYGNGADPKTKIWNEMWATPPLHIISGGMANPVKDYYLNYATEQQKHFPGDQIAHMKTFNPNYNFNGSQLYGLSPLRSYLLALLRARIGGKQANKQLDNGGAFGVLSPKNKEDQFDSTQKKQLHRNLTDANRSKDPLARIFPSSVPLDWLQIGLPLSDLELIKLLQVTDEEIYRAYHVPLQMRSTDGSTFSNQDTQNRAFIYNAVAPICDAISDTLTRFICRPYADLKVGAKEYIIQLDYMSLPELAKDMEKVASWLQKTWQLTPNEVREVLGWGKSTEPGMDMIWIPSGLRPISDAAVSNEEFNRAFEEATQ